MRWMILVVCLWLLGCTRTVYEPIRSVERVVDTVVCEVDDSSVLRALVECDSAGRVLLAELSHLHGERAHSRVDIDSSGRVEVVTRWRTRYVDRIKEVRDTITVVEVREIERPVRYVPRLFIYSFVFSVAALSYLGIRLYLRWKV